MAVHYVRTRPPESVQPDLLRELREYVEWHGGKDPQFINFVCDEEGDPVALVRFTDEDGTLASGLYDFIHMYSEDGAIKWDVTERQVFKRTCEDSVVKAFEGWMA